MLSIIYPYRNRDLDRLKRSLDSLQDQTESKFEVFFVDYGSTPAVAKEVWEICGAYSFVDYRYFPTQFQPWNKSRALNAVIKNLKAKFCFVADVDMIFHPEFIKEAISLQQNEKTVYFQVGFLSNKDDPDKITLEKFESYRKSTAEATGLSMFPVKILKELRGFDEFYHFWGAEDTDMHVRIKNAGYEVEYYDEQVLLLHQWHTSYRTAEKNVLTKELQLKGIVQLNHQHLKNAILNKTTSVNPNGWGSPMTSEELEQLENPDRVLSV
ncbi:MAG: glycosyltransferase, partial [Gillisia sp.]